MPTRNSLPLRRWAAMKYTPQEWARDDLHLRTERIVTLTTARQVGKTTALAMVEDEWLHEEPWDADERGPSNVGILGPTYKKARLSIDMLIENLRKAYGYEYVQTNMTEHRLWIPSTGAKLLWLSSDDPKSVVGETFSHVGTEESQDISDLTMAKFLPTTSIRKAPIVSVGTPDITPDQTWFKANFIRGLDEGYPDYYSATVSAYQNKYMPIEDIILAKQTLSDREFRMLYLGQWVDEEGVVFTGYKKAMLPEGLIPDPAPKPGVQYCVGLDLAVYEDFTVAIVGERNTREAIWMERWNQSDPFETYDRVEELAAKYNNALIVADETGMGIPMVRELRGRGLRVIGQKISSGNKMELIAGLNADMEHKRLTYPAWPALERELKAYVYHPTPTGKLTADAAAGFHDDTVWALLMLNLAFRARRNGGGNGTNWLSEKSDLIRDKVRFL